MIDNDATAIAAAGELVDERLVLDRRIRQREIVSVLRKAIEFCDKPLGEVTNDLRWAARYGSPALKRDAQAILDWLDGKEPAPALGEGEEDG